MTPENELEEALSAATADPARVEDFLEVLKWTPVLVPMPAYPREGEVRLAPGEPIAFPDVEVAGTSGVPAFTSPARLNEAWAGTEDRIVPLTGLQLATLWPPEATALLVNPGTAGVAIQADDVRRLANVFMRLGPRALGEDDELAVWVPGDAPAELLADAERVAAGHSAIASVRYAAARVERPYLVLGLEVEPTPEGAAAVDTLVASLARHAPPAFAIWPLTDPPVDSIAAFVAAQGRPVGAG